MMSVRCLHLSRSGWQCPAEAIEGSDFCADHTPVPDSVLNPDGAGEGSRRPYIYQLAAFLLLLIFLMNYYQTLRQLLAR